MGLLLLFKRPHVFLPMLLQDFLLWFFLFEPQRLLRQYAAYARALLEIISISFLLRTLISPWKGITENYPSRGIQWDKMMQAFTLNVVTRFIGMIIRLATLAIALSLQILLLALFLLRLVLWYAFPVLLFFIPSLLESFRL